MFTPMEAAADVRYRLQEVQACGLTQPVIIHSLDTEPMSWYFRMVESLPATHEYPFLPFSHGFWALAKAV